LLLKRLRDGTISGTIVKDVFGAMLAGEGDADATIERKGLKRNPTKAPSSRSGKEKTFQLARRPSDDGNEGQGRIPRRSTQY